MYDLSGGDNYHLRFTQTLAEDLKSLLAQYVNGIYNNAPTFCFFKDNVDKAKQALHDFGTSGNTEENCAKLEATKVSSLRRSLSSLIDAAYLESALILFQRYINEQNIGKYAAIYDANTEAGLRIMMAMAPLCFIVNTKVGIELLVDAIDERVIVDVLTSPKAPTDLVQSLREVLAE